jgi:hypothetical protein
MTKKRSECWRYVAGACIVIILSPILFPLVLINIAMDKFTD